MTQHTLVLVQETPNKGSRTYYDFETVKDAVNGICRIYELKLKRENPNKREITYDVSELFKYIDSLSDISALVFKPEQKAYVPYTKEWIKNRILTQLRKQIPQ